MLGDHSCHSMCSMSVPPHTSEGLAWQFTKRKVKVCVCINKEKKKTLFLTFNQHSLSSHFLGISPLAPHFLSFYIWVDFPWYGKSLWSVGSAVLVVCPPRTFTCNTPSPWGGSGGHGKLRGQHWCCTSSAQLQPELQCVCYQQFPSHQGTVTRATMYKGIKINKYFFLKDVFGILKRWQPMILHLPLLNHLNWFPVCFSFFQMVHKIQRLVLFSW